jgi:hypothetical protein
MQDGLMPAEEGSGTVQTLQPFSHCYIYSRAFDVTARGKWGLVVVAGQRGVYGVCT